VDPIPPDPADTIYLGPRPRLDGPVTLADPDPRWPSVAARLVASVVEVLGSRVLLLEHVGSTAVPDLPAKPVIDLVLAVADPTDEASYVPDLEALGFWLHVREPEWHQHRLLKQADINLHVFGIGEDEIDRMLAFRDHLRSDVRDRRLYRDTKQALAGRTWAYVQDYADVKSDVVAEIMCRASARRASPSCPGS